MNTLSPSPLISEAAIQKRVKELGEELSEKFSNKTPVMLGVLNGAILFYADLVRAMNIDVICDFVCLKSYKNTKKNSPEFKLICDSNLPLDGKDVVIVENIVDQGFIIRTLKQMISLRSPKSITLVTLLLKPNALKASNLECDYVGFEIPNDFVVGYGTSSNNRYRNLPYIGELQNIN